jgi:lipoyl(octanoyl) transferase
MGKRGSPSDFRVDPQALAARGAELAAPPRGGETTYHGPGQLVVYPIVSLRELGVGPRAYVEGLEDVMVRTLGRHGISARVSSIY